METWFWLAAMASSIIVSTVSLGYLISKLLPLGKRIAPLASEVKKLKVTMKENPEALKFFKER